MNEKPTKVFFIFATNMIRSSSSGSMLAKSLYLLLTFKQLNQIQAHIITTPRPHLLNSILRSISLSTTPQDALQLFNKMLQKPSSHDHFSYTYTLRACSILHAFQMGIQIHARSIKSGHGSNDSFIQNSLMHLYITCSADIMSARQVFDEITAPDVVSWTSLLSGFSKCGFEEEVLIKFRCMGVRPNAMTIVTVLSACSRLRALKLGKSVQGYSLKNLLGGNIFVDNALLSMYVTCCGSLVSASILFHTMGERDVVTWTTMLGGCAQRGYVEEAFRVFKEMIRGGEAKPNEATFVNILSVCASQGALSLGRWVHDYMDRTGVVVNGNVGNALVNMYAKCGDMGMVLKVFQCLKCKDTVSWSIVITGMALNGYIKKALELFSQMTSNGVAPDGVTFLGLLSACSHVGLIDEGLVLFKAMKDSCGIIPEVEHYACMVDMYGRAGLLDEAEGLAREMPMEPDRTVWGSLVNACKLHGDEMRIDRVRESILSRSGQISGGTYALLSNIQSNFSKWGEANNVRDRMRREGIRKATGFSWIEVGI